MEMGAYTKSDTNATVYVVSGASSDVGGGNFNHPVMHIEFGDRLGSAVIDVDGRSIGCLFC